MPPSASLAAGTPVPSAGPSGRTLVPDFSSCGTLCILERDKVMFREQSPFCAHLILTITFSEARGAESETGLASQGRG